MIQHKIPEFKNEAELEHFCMKYVDYLGIGCYKFISPGKTGVPDCIFVFPPGGESVYVEFKHPNGLAELKPTQVDRAEEIRGYGAAVYECDNFRDFETIVAKHLKR